MSINYEGSKGILASALSPAGTDKFPGILATNKFVLVWIDGVCHPEIIETIGRS